MTDDEPIEIPFDPVPSQTNRRDGWTEARQRAFIAALARCASATASARQVGKSVRSAYKLLERPGSESFAAAWDRAVEIGRDATCDCVIDRAMNGAWVPVVRRGRIVRMEFRYFDRLAMSVLAGAGRDLEQERLQAARSRAYRRELREEDRRRLDEERRLAAAEADYRSELEALVARGREKKRESRARIVPL
jgi:hypothetical protein